MTTTSQPAQPWDELEYQQIVAASYQDGKLTVEFADGSKAQLQPRVLLTPDAPEPNWASVRTEEFHLVVPAPSGEIEVPWDVIRVRSDPAFDEFWAKRIGEPFGSLDESRARKAS